MDRRTFIEQTGKTAAAAAATSAFSINALGANEKITLGFMGIKDRGYWVAQRFAAKPNVNIKTFADLDPRVFEERLKGIEDICGKRPQPEDDFRRMFEDKDIDAVVIATPDHWHALGTILACQAGKDVYVEKPTAHSIWESRKMIEAARKYNRVVQVGAQSRSGPYMQEAIEYIRNGNIGDIHFARVHNCKMRTSIGKKPNEPVPDGVNYDMWLGPAKERPFNENHFHYAWHWFWEYSGGDIINDGVHQVDLLRWCLDKDYPNSVYSTGGMHFFHDDQETPDTQVVTWEYDNLTAVFEQTLWAPYMKKTPWEDRDHDILPDWPFNGTRIELYGTKRRMHVSRHGGGWEAFDADGKQVAVGQGRHPHEPHFDNFLECIKTREKPNSDIEELHLSTLLCMYGNISYRTGRRLFIDKKTEGFVDDDEANGYVKRKYREPWVVPEVV